MSRIHLKTIEELEALGDRAVIESHDNQLFQKIFTRVGINWFQPGSGQRYESKDIELPAILFDDGT